MALCPNSTPEAAVKVPTLCDIRYRLADIEIGQMAKKRERIDRTI